MPAVMPAIYSIRHPQLLEEITRAGKLDQHSGTSANICDARRLRRIAARNCDPVRAYRQTQLAAHSLARHSRPRRRVDAGAEHSALAEACLVHVNRCSRRDADLTIVALGKFGGREMSLRRGSRCDLRRRKHPRRPERYGRRWENRRAEGRISPLDARLRPDGEKGPLVSSLATHQTYYETSGAALGTAGPDASPSDRWAATGGVHGNGATHLARGRASVRILFAQIDAMRNEFGAIAVAERRASISRPARAE